MEKKMIKANDPASPFVSEKDSDNYYKQTYYPGLTIRQEFAARFMQGVVSKDSVKGSPKEYAESAVMYADALIAALNNQ